MAYLLYITRAPHHASPARRRITPEEFAGLIAADAQLRRGVHPVPDSPLPAAVFDARPESSAALLYYQGGNVVCKNPDEPAVGKLLEVAGRLGAMVQGEDGEFFSSAFAAPHVPQPSLFEPVANRLRVRFPTRLPPRAEKVLVASSAEEARAARSAAAEVDGALKGKGRKRMSIGFPGSSHEPTAALRSLLIPVRPAVVAAAAGE